MGTSRNLKVDDLSYEQRAFVIEVIDAAMLETGASSSKWDNGHYCSISYARKTITLLYETVGSKTQLNISVGGGPSAHIGVDVMDAESVTKLLIQWLNLPVSASA